MLVAAFLAVTALSVVADVLNRAALDQARAAVLAKWGRIDALLTGTLLAVNGGFCAFSGV